MVEALGIWGTRWIGEIGEEDLDPKLLLWDMHRNIDHDATPAGRTVVEFTFTGLPASNRRWWVVITPGDADVCDNDPGYPVSVNVTASLRSMCGIWRGDFSWADALRSGAVTIEGSERLRRALPRWFILSAFASVDRPGPHSGRLPAVSRQIRS